MLPADFFVVRGARHKFGRLNSAAEINRVPAILESGKDYTDDELRKLLSGHLCRCTGYENILKAVRKTMKKRLGLPEA